MPERAIHWFETIDSTMHEAARLAAAGCPSGTAVVADEQTAGYGRYGRAWHSEKGAGLYVSIVLRPRIASGDLPVVTLALGLATADAITAITGLACDLRWPNDVLLNGRKCAGILTELHDGGAGLWPAKAAVIAGIGINVNHAEFPPDLAAIATSLRIEGRREYSRHALLDALLDGVDRHIAILAADGRDSILDLFARASSYASGRRVVVDLDGQPVEGVTDGLDASGFLILREATGRRRVILAGGVRPA